MLGLLVTAAVAYALLGAPGVEPPPPQAEQHVRLPVPPPAAAGAPAPSEADTAAAAGEARAGSGDAPQADGAAKERAHDTRERDPAAPAASGTKAVPEAEAGSEPEAASEAEAVPPPPPPEKTQGADVVAAAPEAAESGGASPASSPPKPAWKRYARGLSPPEGVARIAVVVRGLGLSSAATEAAIERLPGTISLSFTPYARRAPEWSARARAKGHEVLVDLPMEPRDFPARDPGPQALMVEVPEHGNLDRLDWMLSKGREVVGAVAQMGSRFLDSPQAVEPVLRELRARGLMFVDNGVVPHAAARRIAERIRLPYAVNDRTLDDGQVSRPAIEARLVELERIAQQDGLVVALAHPYPVTIDLLATWSEDLDERGFALVPVTDAVRARPEARAER